MSQYGPVLVFLNAIVILAIVFITTKKFSILKRKVRTEHSISKFPIYGISLQ